MKTMPRGSYLATVVRSSCSLTLAGLVSVHLSVFALADDGDDGSTKTVSTLPNIYLDMRSN